MLYATVRQRKIHVKNPVTVIQNGVGVDMLTLDMDDEWREMTSIVSVFTTKYLVEEERPVDKDESAADPQADTGTTEGDTEKEETETVTVEKEISNSITHVFGETILVPWENLKETGKLSVSCTGYVNGEKVMTTMLPDSFWNIVQNGPMEGDTPLDPTPTLYEQVIAAAGAAQTAANSANNIATELRVAKENGDFDGSNGVTPTITVGDVFTSVPGGEAQVTLTGTPTNVVLNFTIPRGSQGIPGQPGIPGAPGRDGKDGTPGRDGKDGKDGYTPVKGVDYFDGQPGKDGIDGTNGKDGKDGKDGSDASVTAENISKALGYTPVNGSGGTAGQFAVSDGNGGITWLSLTNVGEVGA